MHGYGVYSSTHGLSYTGDWSYNKMHGNGEYHYRDGRKYIG